MAVAAERCSIVHVNLRSLAISPGGVRPIWFLALATVVLGGLLVVDTGGNTEAVLLLAAAVAVSCVHLAVAISGRTQHRRIHEVLVRVAPPALLTAGFAWMLGGAATGASPGAVRDGAILLLTGAAILAISSAVHLPLEWFTAYCVAAAVTASWLMIAPDSRNAGGSTWAVAALVVLAGLSMTAFPMVRLTIRPRSRPDDVRHPAFWFASGLCLVLLASWLALDTDVWSVWYLPVLAISVLVPGLDQEEQPARWSTLDSARFLNAMPVWAAFMGTLLLAVASIAWLLATENAPERWGSLALATAVVVAFCTALSIAGLLRSSSVHRLSDYAAMLLRQSRTDALTGLDNRQAITERFAIELQRAARFNHPLSIGLVDIDDFKSINDTWGHQTGDEVLQLIARRLEHELRQIDVVGRYGGEEFLILLPETAAEGAWVAADRLLRSIRTVELPIATGPRSITISIGLATFPQHGRSEPDLIAAADEALYVAKRSGKNRVAVAER